MKKLKVLISFLFLTFFSYAQGQSFLGTNDFEKETSRGIIVVEFWASWNNVNEVKWLDNLKECEVYRVDIGQHMDLQTEFEITAVPTIIIFNNGNVEETFTANIMFQLEADKKTIQNSIDTIKLNKFQ